MTHFFACPRCGIGRFRPIKATYVQMHHDKLLTLPDAPAHICDVCGYQEFSGEVVQRVRKMLRENESDRPISSSHKTQGH